MPRSSRPVRRSAPAPPPKPRPAPAPPERRFLVSELLSERQRGELWSLTLLCLAILLGLSLTSPSLLGERAAAWFPSGNLAGWVGLWVAAALRYVFGGAAHVAPLVPLAWAVAYAVRPEPSLALRWTALIGSVMVLLSSLSFTIVASEGGWVDPGLAGRVVGGGLSLALGRIMASLLVLFLFAAACVVTVGWNPVQAGARQGRSAMRGVPCALRGMSSALRGLRRSGRARADAAVAGRDWAEVTALPEPRTVTPQGAFSAAVPPPSQARHTATRPPRLRAAETISRDDAPVGEGPMGEPALPPATLLQDAPERDATRSASELRELGDVLVDKLDTFKVVGKLVGMTAGPVVTQFEFVPAAGIKVSRIANLEADLALALHAPCVRIVAPIPGKGAVGIEVPNPSPEMVFLREIVETPGFHSSKALLPLALGKDIAGNPYVVDLARMPHLLIAGATGAGKSVCINTIVASLVYRHTPETLRLLMVDPKMVELIMYNDLPHLRHPVVTDNNDAAGALKWAVIEMERRYKLLSVNSVRNLQDFNRRLDSGTELRTADPQGPEGDPDRHRYTGGALPYIVVIIDEFADLMMTAQGDVEKPLALLAQKARAIGIHLILATQRPSVNVITGLIKANFPSRIAFRVSSKVDSRTILDQNGAESLLGNGDMLLLPPGQSEPVRIQGAYLSTEDTESFMDWFREQARLGKESGTSPQRPPEEDILSAVRASEGAEEGGAVEGAEGLDPLFRDAGLLCLHHQGGSTSLLQRRMKIGYGRAARVIDQLEQMGVLGPADGSKPRQVMMDMIRFDQAFPE
jgi:DNA segregation ATPase FtsK/SpoIIIE, S-DNA-T family